MISGLIVSVIVVAAWKGAGIGGAFSAVGEGLPGSEPLATRVAAQEAPSNSPSLGDDIQVAAQGGSMRLWHLVVFGSVCPIAGIAWWGYRWKRSQNSSRPEDISDDARLPENLRAHIFAKRQTIYRVLSNDNQILIQSRIEVRHVMTTRLFIVSPTTPAEELARTMTQNHVRHLLVCNNGRLMGVISDRDMHTRKGETAVELMTGEPFTISPSTPVGLVVTTLINRGFSCVPVVEDDQVRGLVTTTDLMMTLQCVVQLLERIFTQVNPEAGASEAPNQSANPSEVMPAA
ncbi:MAG: CBS domain-containing protein [Planctomycetes bacterium]|nr:CBS domain-containing protein [Planctomycetota bacterium]